MHVGCCSGCRPNIDERYVGQSSSESLTLRRHALIVNYIARLLGDRYIDTEQDGGECIAT